MSEKITFKLDSDIRDRLRVRKGNKSYEKFIDAMLSYFEMTGVDPTRQLLPPETSIINSIERTHQTLYKRMEDLIKILRSIELNKIDVIINSLATPSSSLEVQKVQEQIIQLYDVHEKIINENNELREIIENQNAKIIMISNIIRSVFTSKYLQIDNDNNYLISEDKVVELITNITNIIEDVHKTT